MGKRDGYGRIDVLENRVHLEVYCRGNEELEEDELTEQDWDDLNAVHYYD